ncbi:hypothetical protein H312_02387 [Anncaliia algerae PRA339]|uniref:Uncharacterized protein n=1 Tax=Anncaliia algerae PRA339 TaxID=1288291 RepID=A0A059EZB3_9MICR|nr:hypothetical protein H312_02387 [Anncaliia algerae PRA339]
MVFLLDIYLFSMVELEQNKDNHVAPQSSDSKKLLLESNVLTLREFATLATAQSKINILIQNLEDRASIEGNPNSSHLYEVQLQKEKDSLQQSNKYITSNINNIIKNPRIKIPKICLEDIKPGKLLHTRVDTFIQKILIYSKIAIPKMVILIQNFRWNTRRI